MIKMRIMTRMINHNNYNSRIPRSTMYGPLYYLLIGFGNGGKVCRGIVVVVGILVGMVV